VMRYLEHRYLVNIAYIPERERGKLNPNYKKKKNIENEYILLRENINAPSLKKKSICSLDIKFNTMVILCSYRPC
jgi:hypothetical protein